jgi:acyl-CoA thioester hydrolase
MTDRIPELPPGVFPACSSVPFRYSDTDRQGHINNGVFATLCETGRVELFQDALDGLEVRRMQFVIVRLVIDFLGEMHWPGAAVVGTGVTRLGTSSIAMRQGIFSGGRCAAMAESVVVVMNMDTRRPMPIPDDLRATYEALRLPASV